MHPVLVLRSSCARRGITPAFGYGPRLGSVRLDFHQQATRPARRALWPPPTPSRLRSTSRLITGYRTRTLRRSPQNHRAGEGLPSSRRHHANVPSPLRRGVHRGCKSRLLTPSMAFAVTDAARLSHPPAPKSRHNLTTRQASLHATDRSLAPPKGLSTLGFDPTRFQTEPPACYRASWQLPGPDSHRQATTSMNRSRFHIIDLHSSWRTLSSR